MFRFRIRKFLASIAVVLAVSAGSTAHATCNTSIDYSVLEPIKIELMHLISKLEEKLLLFPTGSIWANLIEYQIHQANALLAKLEDPDSNLKALSYLINHTTQVCHPYLSKA